MEFLKVREAAQRLNVSPSTLRAWERRFGYPVPDRSPGGHRRYREADVAALSDALEQGLSIASAIARVRHGHAYDAEALVGPLCALDPQRAARVVEGAIALRSVERAVEEVLLPALAEVDRRHGPHGVEWAFAAAWADEWLLWGRRLAMQEPRPVRILFGEAAAPEPDLGTIATRALRFFCARAGAHVLNLPVHATRGIASAAALLRPSIVVVSGDHASDDDVARWIYATRSTAPLALHRRSVRGRGAFLLDPSPLAAYRQLLALLDAAPGETALRTLPPAVND